MAKKSERFTDPKEIQKIREQIQRIRERYTQILDERFPTAELLEKYQDEKYPFTKDTLKGPASTILQKAYPVLQYNEEGELIDNRDQGCINTIVNFVTAMSEKKDK